MTTKFLDPGGDATFKADIVSAGGFWGSVAIVAPSIATDFVHGNHLKSFSYGGDASGNGLNTATGILADSGSRISFYIYVVARPSATCTIATVQNAAGATVVRLRLSSAGVLQLWEQSSQRGTGTTLANGVWYRISLAYTITSTTVNRFEVFKDGISDISLTNITITNTTSSRFFIGNGSGNTSISFRSSDHYIDDSNALTDPGNIWVTAKRPVSNGTNNDFATQIGSGGSGYGSGHSPQVNERPLDTANGWSTATNSLTEEYNIEAANVGDIDITNATIVDYMGWVSASHSSGAASTRIIVNGSLSFINTTGSAVTYTKAAGSSTYPAGTGTDIGLESWTSAGTRSLYECGILIAYIPISLIKTVDGLAKASVKVVNGVTIAGVETINGLA